MDGPAVISLARLIKMESSPYVSMHFVGVPWIYGVLCGYRRLLLAHSTARSTCTTNTIAYFVVRFFLCS